MKKALSILCTTFSLFLLAFSLANCNLTRSHPTELIPVQTQEQVDAHQVIGQSTDRTVEVEILPDSLAKDADVSYIWDQIFGTPVSTTEHEIHGEVGAGATITNYHYTKRTVPGGFRLFAVRYGLQKNQQSAIAMAGIGTNVQPQSETKVVFDWLLGPVTLQSRDVLKATFGPVSIAGKTNYMAPNMLYTLETLRKYVPPVVKEEKPFPPK